MKALLVDNTSGKPAMIPGNVPDPIPGELELLIKVEATALNRADLLQKAGSYPPPEGESSILGLEMAGTVKQTGANVKEFREGDRVFGLLGGGGYAEYCTIHQGLAMRIPENFSFEEAAAIPEVFLTAYQAVMWLGDLQQNESILIHAGASGVGTAAIQLARKLKKARIAVTAGRDEKLDFCRKLGADLTINYKKQDFAEELETQFGRNSVDVIIDVVGSPYWGGNIHSLAMDGRLVYLAMMGGSTVKKMNLVPLLRKRLTIRGSTLRNRGLAYKTALTTEFAAHVLPFIKKGTVYPVIDSVYDWKNVEKAHARMDANLNTGKIILNGM